MSEIQIGLVLVAVLVAALFTLVVGRKTLRDRRESRAAVRRDRYRAALLAGDGTITSVLAGVRGARTQLDLADVLGTTGPALGLEARWSLHEAARASGLIARLYRALGARSPIRRGRAVLILSRLRLPANVTTLAPLLRDPDSDVRRLACSGIAQTRDGAGVSALVGAVCDQLLAPERMIESLAEPWAVPALLKALEALNADDERLIAPRASIARALGLAGDERAAPALESMLQHGAPEERVSAARALGTSGRPASRPALESRLADPSWQLRAQAATALGLLGDEQAVPALGAALDDRAWWVRRNAAGALRCLGASGIAALRAALEHSDPYARDRAREELALHGTTAVPLSQLEAVA